MTTATEIVLSLATPASLCSCSMLYGVAAIGTEGNWLDVRLAILSAAKDGTAGTLRVLEIVTP